MTGLQKIARIKEAQDAQPYERPSFRAAVPRSQVGQWWDNSSLNLPKLFRNQGLYRDMDNAAMGSTDPVAQGLFSKPGAASRGFNPFLYNMVVNPGHEQGQPYIGLGGIGGGQGARDKFLGGAAGIGGMFAGPAILGSRVVPTAARKYTPNLRKLLPRTIGGALFQGSYVVPAVQDIGEGLGEGDYRKVGWNASMLALPGVAGKGLGAAGRAAGGLVGPRTANALGGALTTAGNVGGTIGSVNGTIGHDVRVRQEAEAAAKAFDDQRIANIEEGIKKIESGNRAQNILADPEISPFNPLRITETASGFTPGALTQPKVEAEPGLGSQVVPWLNANKGKVLAGAGGLAALTYLLSRRRKNNYEEELARRRRLGV